MLIYRVAPVTLPATEDTHMSEKGPFDLEPGETGHYKLYRDGISIWFARTTGPGADANVIVRQEFRRLSGDEVEDDQSADNILDTFIVAFSWLNRILIDFIFSGIRSFDMEIEEARDATGKRIAPWLVGVLRTIVFEPINRLEDTLRDNNVTSAEKNDMFDVFSITFRLERAA